MLRSEFEILTGIYVDEEMMDVINERYMEMELDKHVFCEAYKSNMNGLAQIIQREANRRQFEKMDDINKAIKELNDKISGLKAELEKEQEWKPYGKNSAMNAVDYTRLLHGYQPMGKAAAARLVAEEFGFKEECVHVMDQVPVYKQDRHGVIRKFGSEERPPVYASTDWNYVRFDVIVKGQTFSYEMVNGDLEPYEQ